MLWFCVYVFLGKIYYYALLCPKVKWPTTNDILSANIVTYVNSICLTWLLLNFCDGNLFKWVAIPCFSRNYQCHTMVMLCYCMHTLYVFELRRVSTASEIVGVVYSDLHSSCTCIYDTWCYVQTRRALACGGAIERSSRLCFGETLALFGNLHVAMSQAVGQRPTKASNTCTDMQYPIDVSSALLPYRQEKTRGCNSRKDTVNFLLSSAANADVITGEKVQRRTC